MGFASFHVPFLGFLVASFFIQGLEAVSCPKDWFLFEQHCYGFFTNKLNWNDAETECTSHGQYAHLASILSKREMDAISSALLTGYPDIYRIWIGLYKVLGGKIRFRWVDAALVDYIPWAPSEPSVSRRNCGQLSGNDYKHWDLQFCCTTQPYLCKMALY